MNLTAKLMAQIQPLLDENGYYLVERDRRRAIFQNYDDTICMYLELHSPTRPLRN